MSKRMCFHYFHGVCQLGVECPKSHAVPEFDKRNTIVLSSKLKIALKVKNQHRNLLKKIIKMDDSQKLPVDYQDLIDSNFKCSICFEVFIKPTALSCTHVFCEWCIHNWLKSTARCPICRKVTVYRLYCRDYETFVKEVLQKTDLYAQIFHSLLEEKRAIMRAKSDLSSTDVEAVEDTSEQIRKLELLTSMKNKSELSSSDAEAFEGIGESMRNLTIRPS